MKFSRFLLAVTLLLGVASLFLGEADLHGARIDRVVSLLDYAVLIMLLGETALEFFQARLKRLYLKRNAFALAFTALYVGLFIYDRVAQLLYLSSNIANLPVAVVIIRNLFLLLRVFSRLRRLQSFLKEISTHPAQTILLSFLVVILAGALLLMMPFTGADGKGLGFINALFTSTSAVCVTGLIVVDTAKAFSLYGQVIILMLIQIGGLGIMLLSYFAVFVLRRSVSIEDKMLISYMLSEKDMGKLAQSLKNIIYTTFIIEAVGTLLLFVGFREHDAGSLAGVFFLSLFHSVSAFCNAGFSLFSNSLEGVSGNVLIILTIAGLIVLGGISFSVITNLRQFLGTRIRRLFAGVHGPAPRLSVNTKVVLIATVILLAAGTLLIYGSEHRNSLANYPLGDQYLSAFFQSVTLRTAGFNSIPFSALRPATYMIMVLFMFIGGASGSTAGGIKVNTLTVMLAYLSSSVRDKDSVIVANSSIPIQTVLRSFLILLFGLSVVALGTVILLFTEHQTMQRLLFEAVSAFGTVGLSTGITSSLSTAGKVVIIFLMFLGRVGPLTVLTAASLSSKKIHIEYPQGDIAIG